MSVQTLTKENFEAEVLRAEKPVLVDFWANGCPYCRRLSPVLDRLAEKLGDGVAVGKVNVGEQPELESQYGIELVPTLYLFIGGRRGENLVAPASQAQIEIWMRDQQKARV